MAWKSSVETIRESESKTNQTRYMNIFLAKVFTASCFQLPWLQVALADKPFPSLLLWFADAAHQYRLLQSHRNPPFSKNTKLRAFETRSGQKVRKKGAIWMNLDVNSNPTKTPRQTVGSNNNSYASKWKKLPELLETDRESNGCTTNTSIVAKFVFGTDCSKNSYPLHKYLLTWHRFAFYLLVWMTDMNSS